MASYGFHSPQVSEDTAWLPAWLQPHQLPAFGHRAKDENRFSQLCKSLAESPKHVPDVGDCYLSNKSDARFSNLRLHLSGDDSSAFENTTSSEGLNLHLHLSSFGMSDYGTSTAQVKEQPQLSKQVADNTNNQSKVEDKGPLSSTQAKNKLSFPSKKIKDCQKYQKSGQGKLLTTDISYAIELSIAASEAMVISDIVNSSLLSENLPASSILEIAVRVERARKEFSLDVSDDDDDFEVNDGISDLDEATMADAFNDVGISLPQVFENSTGSSVRKKSPLDKFTCDSNTHVLESQFVHERTVENNKLWNLGDGAQACDVSLPGQILIQSSETLPVKYDKSCLKSQEKVDACNLQQIHTSLFPVQMELKEGLEIPKVLEQGAKTTPIGKAVTMKNIRELCNREFSFISESDEPEAIASSSTPHESFCKGTEGVVQETCGISSFDPLCSVVPCSISSDQPTQLDENITLPDKYGRPFNSIAEEPILVEQSSDVSALPKRRKFSSLRHYSVQDTNNLMKFTGNCVDVDDSNKNNIDERGLPVVFDNKRHRLSASRETLNNDIEGESVEKISDAMVINGKTMNCTKKEKPVKRVRFLGVKSSLETNKRNNKGIHCRSYKRVNKSNSRSKYTRNGKSTCGHASAEKVMIFQGLEFLLTGFSSQKEKELEELIRSHGGYVLLDIPSNFPYARGKHQMTELKLPIVISAKKVQSTKFLYGCATNTWTLNSHWLYDSVQAGSLLPPLKFMTRPIQGIESNRVAIGEPFCLSDHIFIFDRVGIILNGKVSFCTKFSKIIKHGGGKVFKSFESLVKSVKKGSITLGLVLVETEANVSRHLKHCALENNLQTVPANWIVNSLYSGELLPLKKDRCAPFHKIKMPTFTMHQDIDMSQEI